MSVYLQPYVPSMKEACAILLSVPCQALQYFSELQQNVDYPRVSHPKRQISESTFSSFCFQTTKNQRLLHAIKYCVISIKYCTLYVLYCIVMVILSQRNLQILCTVWLLGSVIRTIDYPNYRWSQLVRIIDVLLYLIKVTSKKKITEHKRYVLIFCTNAL